jgi:hypothetical protein
VRFAPTHDARGLISDLYALPEVRKVSATGLHGFSADEEG